MDLSKNLQYQDFELRIEEMKEHGLQLILQDGTTMPLQMGFGRGPLRYDLRDTAEFLMTNVYSPNSLETLTEEFNLTGIYGPKTLKVLEEIGYATRRRPKIMELVYGLDNYIGGKGWTLI